VQLVLDMVAGDYVARNIACLAEDGRHVTIAVQGGAKAEVPMWLVMTKRLTLTGSTMRARDVGFKGLVAQEILRNVWPLIERGACRPIMDQTFPCPPPPPPMRGWRRATISARSCWRWLHDLYPP
jgi:NADPH:quinone reductase-like Zn-dependent oxidoreductase